MLAGKILHLFSFGDNFFLFAKKMSKNENKKYLIACLDNASSIRGYTGFFFT